MVLNLESLVQSICTLITRPLLYRLCKLLLVLYPAEIDLYFKYTSVNTLNMKYTSSIHLEIFWYFEIFWAYFKYTSSYLKYTSSILQVHFNLLKTSTLYFNFLKCICISFLGQKYTWSRLSKLTNLHSKLEVYFKYTFWIDAFFKLRSMLLIDFPNRCIYFQNQKYTWSRLYKHVFIFKLWSILKADFQYWCIYFETLKYTWSRLSKFMNLCANSEVYLK